MSAVDLARCIHSGAADADLIDVDTSVGKALTLLDAFASIEGSVGLTELARRTGIPKSTTHRLLSILQQHRLLDRNGTRYCLGERLFELGNRVSYCRPRSLRDRSLPFLGDLYELTHETVNLAVLDGTDVVYVEKLFGHHPAKTPSVIGGRSPAYRSALGKALLAWSGGDAVEATMSRGLSPRTGYTIVAPARLEAELTSVRSTGVAFDREESSIGLNCVASPIFTRSGHLVGSVSVCGPTTRFEPSSYAGAVKQAASGIGTGLTG